MELLLDTGSDINLLKLNTLTENTLVQEGKRNI